MIHGDAARAGTHDMSLPRSPQGEKVGLSAP